MSKLSNLKTRKAKKNVRFNLTSSNLSPSTQSHTTLKYLSTSSRSNPSFDSFKRDITHIFFEILLMVKLYHWNTYIYATHKATDELYERLNKNIDRFMEVLLGKTANIGAISPSMASSTEKMRIKMGTGSNSTITLFDLDNKNKLIYKLSQFKSFLVGLNINSGLRSIQMQNYDLFTIRDEILADLNQFLYLLTLR